MFEKLQIFLSSKNKGEGKIPEELQESDNEKKLRIIVEKLVSDIIISTPEFHSANTFCITKSIQACTHVLLNNTPGMDNLLSNKNDDKMKEFMQMPDLVDWVASIIKKFNDHEYYTEQMLKSQIGEFQRSIIHMMGFGNITINTFDGLSVLSSIRGNLVEKKRLGQALLHALPNDIDPLLVQQLKEKFPQIFDL